MYYGSGTDHVTRARWASGQPDVKRRRGRHLERMTSYQKSDSVSRCVFTWRTILPNFIPIRFEMMES